jgi:hypothetical protein
MKRVLDSCNSWVEDHLDVRLEDIYCEGCLEILHERAAVKLDVAYKYLCDVKRQRYETSFRIVKKEVEEKNLAKYVKK